MKLAYPRQECGLLAFAFTRFSIYPFIETNLTAVIFARQLSHCLYKRLGENFREQGALQSCLPAA